MARQLEELLAEQHEREEAERRFQQALSSSRKRLQRTLDELEHTHEKEEWE